MDCWKRELENDLDKDFVLGGITKGFHIIEPQSTVKESTYKNHKSATDPSIKDFIEKIIVEENELNNYIVTDVKPVIVSPIGSVPKSDGGHRLIHDCSMPSGSSLNDYAPIFDKYKYESVDTAVSMITAGSFLAKVDIKSAYRHIPLHPHSQQATGLQWTFKNGETRYMYDVKLPFGAKASPTIFHRISQAVKRMMYRWGFKMVVAYQDDFLVIGHTQSECDMAWRALINLLKDLGLDINKNKLVAPCTKLTFLGKDIDTVACNLTLPQEKLVVLRKILSEWKHKSRATKQQLQSLAGELNFAARVVRGGRTFLRRILNCINKLKKCSHKTKLGGAAKRTLNGGMSLCQSLMELQHL